MILQQGINGIILGSEYALFALGLSLVFGSLRLINFAHGAIYMLGTYTGLVILQTFNLPLFWVGLPLGLLVGGGAAVVIEGVTFAPLRNRVADHLAAPIATIASAAIIVGAMVAATRGESTAFFKEVGTFPLYTIGPIRASLLQGLVFGLSVVIIILLNVFIRRTSLGLSIRAVAADPGAAGLCGVNVHRVITWTFFISGALAGTAGVLMGALLNSATATMADAMLLKGFAIITVGGLGSPVGALVAGLVLGLSEVFSIEFASGGVKDAIAFTLMFVVLLIRPHGIFGKPEVQRA